ncbi:MAG: adenylyl-sulfate kinase [Bacteroidota bacterium]
MENIFPVTDIIPREAKEKYLNQRSRVIWFTGLSGAGKTTISRVLEKELFARKFFCQIMDGDNIRSGINNNLDFTKEGRTENIRRIAEVSKLYLNSGIITINSFITPTPELRKIAREIIPKPDLIEVYIEASLAMCEERDTKGLYKKAREGKIKNFTGIDSPFIPPKNPDLVLKTENCSVEENVQQALDYLIPILTLS